jgi:hypothetical protein
LVWEPSASNAPVLLAWSESGTFGDPEAGRLYSTGEIISGGGTVLYYGSAERAFLHDNLQSSSLNHYSIWSYLDGEWSVSLLTSAITNPSAVSVFPWSEGFEKGLTDWRQTFISGSFEWKSATTGDKGRPAAPYEGELMAYFHAPQYEQRITTLVSPLLELVAGETYYMDFRHYQTAWDGDQDWLKVLVKPENGSQWTELAYFTDEATDWMQRRITIPFSEPVQIAFQGVSNYGYGIGVDDIKVYTGSACSATFDEVSNIVLNDSTETTMNVSWTMPAGSNVLVVMRKSAVVSDLPDPGFTYTANAQFGQGDQLPDGSFVVYAGSGSGVEISGLDHTSKYHMAFFSYTDINCYPADPVRADFSTVQVFYPLKVIVSANGQPLEGAVVTLGENQKLTDAGGVVEWLVGHTNTYFPLSVSQAGFVSHWQRYLPNGELELNIDLVSADPPVPRHLRHTKSLKSVTLSWDPVINENLDGYEPFVLNLPGWTLEDKDGLVTYGLSGLLFPNKNYIGSFIVLDPYYAGLLQADFDLTAYSGRHVLAAFASASGANDDWLMSPELEVEEGDGWHFMARSISDTYGLESIRVLVSDQSSDTKEFELLSSEKEMVPVEWTAYSFDLSAYAGKRVRLAIQYVSNNTHALLIDQLHAGPYASIPDAAPGAEMLSAGPERILPGKPEAMDKQTVQRSLGATVPDKGRIGYSVQLNGVLVGETTGFSTTTFSMNVDDCLGNEFQIQSKDEVYSAISEWTAPYVVNACHAVSFVVYGINKQPIEGALVKFENHEALTDAEGQVIFLGIENLSNASYEVSAHGFVPQSGDLIVFEDLETPVVLEAVDTDNTTVKNEDINIFPNPVSDDLSVQGIYGLIGVSVIDLSGRTVRRMQIEAYHAFHIPLGDLQPGIYLVELNVGGKTFFRKIMKR